MDPSLEHFLDSYRQIDRQRLHLLDSIYSVDVEFIDPVHRLVGLAALHRYFERLYQNLTDCAFDFHETVASGNSACVCWELSFAHPRLQRGRIITVAGSSQLRFNDDGKACYHRDYFDLGAMLYEHLPVLGRACRFLKQRLAS